MSQMSEREGSLMKGSNTAVEASGMKVMSDSLMAFQPRMELPSKLNPSVNDSSLSLWNGIVVCCHRRQRHHRWPNGEAPYHRKTEQPTVPRSGAKTHARVSASNTSD